MKISGIIKTIVYEKPETDWKILIVKCANDEVRVTGCIRQAFMGDYIDADGEYENNKYGFGFKAVNIRKSVPSDVKYFNQYLTHNINGIGPVTANKIVESFGKDTFHVLVDSPDKVAKTCGISEKKALSFSEQMKEKSSELKNKLFLLSIGVSDNLAKKIEEEFKEDAYKVVSENPYRLTDLQGVSFKTADKIASKAGVNKDSKKRIQSGIKYTMSLANGAGHTYLPYGVLIKKAAEFLTVSETGIKTETDAMVVSGELTRQGDKVYLPKMFNMEMNVAKKLHNLSVYGKRIHNEQMEEDIKRVEKAKGVTLAFEQRQGVAMAVREPVSVITGGPGTGKTTVLNVVISALMRFGFKEERILLAAPTGKAAKRMTEQTGVEASTIHRMVLGLDSANVDAMKDDNDMYKGELDADVIIIDETSMISLSVANMLLKVVEPGTKVLFVGDVDQLPSIGAGQFLRDIISSGKIPVCRLTKIFRQASTNKIVQNAYHINNKEELDINPSYEDFIMRRRVSKDDIMRDIKTLVRALPRHLKIDANDVQILCPMRRGELGIESLNCFMQDFMNPESPDKNEIVIKKNGRELKFREGDKVIHIKNNYDLSCVKDYGENFKENGYKARYEECCGVFNGETGIIKKIETDGNRIKVEILYDDKLVFYEDREDLEIELAYAITIHKSQGSEYPAVIIPVLTAGAASLYNKNLLYTAVTRAKHCVALLGSPKVVYNMIDNDTANDRYSSLSERIKELCS